MVDVATGWENKGTSLTGSVCRSLNEGPVAVSIVALLSLQRIILFYFQKWGVLILNSWNLQGWDCLQGIPQVN